MPAASTYAIPDSAPNTDATQQRMVYADDQSAPWGYWRKADGWITFLPFGENSVDLVMKGTAAGTMQPLAKYGQFPIAGGPGWHPTNDPYYMLVRNGGVGEMPAAQVFALRWHLPPGRQAKPSHRLLWEQVAKQESLGLDQDDALCAVLPQLRGVDIPESHACSLCPDRTFLSADDLRKHESVMHREEVQQRDTRNAIAEALRANSGSSGPDSKLMEVMVDILGKLAESNAEMKAQIHQAIGAEPRRRGRPPKSGHAFLVDDVGEDDETA